MSLSNKDDPRQKDSHDVDMQSADLSPNKIASHRLGNILAQSLAAYVLLRSKEPVCEVIQDLFEIESEAAALVSACCTDQEKITNLRGTLVSTFSLLPIGGGKSVRDVTPKAKAIPNRKNHKTRS